MVNVGGRSKGCSTCRRRRVKCDETRPICKRCQRCGFECKGPKDITFIEGNIVKSRRTYERAAGTITPDDGETHSSSHPIHPSTSLRGNDLDICICYSRKHLRSGGAINLVLQKSQLSDIVSAGTFTANGQVFHQAFLGFAMIVFGTEHEQSYITDQGYATHGLALKQLNQTLCDPKCYTRDDVILSVATLAILECVVPTGTKNYLSHMIGLERLLELRDPRSHCAPESCELYKSVRHMILFASLRTGKPSILAREEWKTILRANCTDEELQEQDLYDVLADCTILAAQRDKTSANLELDPERATHQQDKLKRRALDLLSHLRAWRKRWDSDESNSYCETSAALAGVEPTQKALVDDSPTTHTIFKFSNESAAVMFMLYNTTLIFVLRILASLSLQNLDIHSKQQPLLQDAGYSDDLWNYTKHEYLAAEGLAALEVCRCIPYYAIRKSRLDTDCSPVVHWAVTTARATLCGNESTAGRWMMDLLKDKGREVVAKALWAA